MEPLVPPDVLSSTSSDPRELIDDVLRGRVDRSDIDVRTFLLDPPPTDAELARTDRRRMLVRRGSVAIAAIVAVLLVAPWPSGGDERGSEPVSEPVAEEGFAEPVADVAPAAVRLDAEPAPTRSVRPARSRQPDRRTRTTPARPTPTVATPRATPVSAPSPRAPRPAVQAPAAPAPAPSGGAGGAIRAPVL